MDAAVVVEKDHFMDDFFHQVGKSRLMEPRQTLSVNVVLLVSLYLSDLQVTRKLVFLNVHVRVM